MLFKDYLDNKRELKTENRLAKYHKKIALENEMAGIREFNNACKIKGDPARKNEWMENARIVVKEKYIYKAEIYYQYASDEYAFCVILAKTMGKKQKEIDKYKDLSKKYQEKSAEMKELFSHSYADLRKRIK